MRDGEGGDKWGGRGGMRRGVTRGGGERRDEGWGEGRGVTSGGGMRDGEEGWGGG